ncbi:TIGR04255 family protein [Cryobacterium glaciale]|uniref:TIGR04255 family protein n=1 Tax=Cryobacterium glaciale TaxID=1259145 RepID=A0A4R8UU05_9MICO|nr:TIGR04255 family protein [Cryobacterium glaciale]TFB71899.1 TIGR04255 family protein [Cryobacterium glaciale]
MGAQKQKTRAKLENSPLILVLCEIRFAPVLAIEKFVPDIQEQLRLRGFPGYKASSLQQIQLSAQGPSFQEIPRWVFTSQDGSQILTLTTESVSLQVTKYHDFEAFLELLHVAVDVIASVVKPMFAGRVGLRYVDAVVNIDTQDGEYFDRAVLSFEPKDLGVISLLSSQQVLARTHVGQLTIRMNQVQNSPLLPPDLQSPELDQLSSVQVGVHAILDIDSSDEGQSDFTPAALQERLWAVHVPANSAFWKSITPYAKEKWGMTEGSPS